MKAENRERWLCYALGGGWGHLQRMLALVERYSRAQHACTILTNAEYLPPSSQPVDWIRLSPTASPSAVQEAIHSCAGQSWSGWVVDTFPRGITGELANVIPRLACRKVLIHRYLPPAYVDQKQLVSFAGQHYDLILQPADLLPAAFAHLPQTRRVLPLLLRSPHELTDATAARALLRVDGSRPVVLVCAAGKPAEQPWYGEVTAALHHAHQAIDVRCLAAACPPHCPPGLWVQHWPGMEAIAAADVVIGGGGYHTVHECLALGVPLIGKPWPRLYDDQRTRLINASHQACVQLAEPDLLRQVLHLLSR